MKRVLIFGSEGFVGPYLVSKMKSLQYEVYGVDFKDASNNKELSHYYQADILDKELVNKIIHEVNPTHIVNLAAISSVGASWKQPDATIKVNVIGTLNILEATSFLDNNPKILIVGSSEQYINH